MLAYSALLIEPESEQWDLFIHRTHGHKRFLPLLDVNNGRVFECRKAKPVIDLLGSDGELDFELFKGRPAGSGNFTLAARLVSGHLAGLFWERCGKNRLGDLPVKTVGVLVVDPFFKFLVSGALLEKVELAVDGKARVLIVDLQDQNCCLIFKGIKKQGITVAEHGINNLVLLGLIHVEDPFRMCGDRKRKR